MGIIANAKEFIKDLPENAASEISKAAVLSPNQVQQIEDQKEQYWLEKPNMTGEETKNFIGHKLGAAAVEVYQAYLEQIKTMYSPVDVGADIYDKFARVRYFDITKWVTDPSEKNLDKLVNVYQVLSEENCNIALIYNRKQSGTNIIMAVNNTGDSDENSIATSFNERLASAVMGNFPGAEIGEKGDVPECLESAAEDGDANNSVAIVSNLASEKSENFISQSMEKLLDGIVPKSKYEEYTIVLLAKPVSNQLEAQNRLFELYSDLAPYASWQIN